MVCVLSRVQLFATPWAVACQVPLFMEFSRQAYWSRLPFPILEGISPAWGLNSSLLHLLHWQADSLALCHLGTLDNPSTGAIALLLNIKLSWGTGRFLSYFVTRFCLDVI